MADISHRHPSNLSACKVKNHTTVGELADSLLIQLEALSFVERLLIARFVPNQSPIPRRRVSFHKLNSDRLAVVVRGSTSILEFYVATKGIRPTKRKICEWAKEYDVDVEVEEQSQKNEDTSTRAKKFKYKRYMRETTGYIPRETDSWSGGFYSYNGSVNDEKEETSMAAAFRDAGLSMPD